MSKMRAGNQGREGEQSMVPELEPEDKGGQGKNARGIHSRLFFLTTKYFNIQF